MDFIGVRSGDVDAWRLRDGSLDVVLTSYADDLDPTPPVPIRLAPGSFDAVEDRRLVGLARTGEMARARNGGRREGSGTGGGRLTAEVRRVEECVEEVLEAMELRRLGGVEVAEEGRVGFFEEGGRMLV